MNLKKIALVFFATVTTGSVVTIAAVSNDASITLTAAEATEHAWNHYTRRASTSTASGCVEYWVCCSCSEHEHVTAKPSSGTFTDSGIASVTVDSSDDRYIPATGDTTAFTDYLKNLGFGTVTPVTDEDGNVTYSIGGFNKTDVSNVIIPEGVSTIQADTFKNKTNVDWIVLPASITTLEKDSFKNVKNLTVYTVAQLDVSKSGNTQLTVYQVENTGWKYVDGVPTPITK